MKTQIVTQRILTAGEGCCLTNGDSFVKTVVLPESADPALWWEIPETEVPNAL